MAAGDCIASLLALVVVLIFALPILIAMLPMLIFGAICGGLAWLLGGGKRR